MTDLVQAARVYDRTEAIVLSGILNAEGKFAVVAELPFLDAMPHLTFALGGFRIMVTDDEVAEAKEIIAAAQDCARRAPEELILRCDFVSWWISLIITIVWMVPFPLRYSEWRECEGAAE